MPLNYCDYDALEHYESGAFSKQFKTDLSDKIEEAEKDTTLSKNDIDSFKDGQYYMQINKTYCFISTVRTL